MDDAEIRGQHDSGGQRLRGRPQFTVARGDGAWCVRQAQVDAGARLRDHDRSNR